MASAISIHNTVNGRPTTALLLGSGELGKEVAIELMRMGIKVVACDRYDNAPAMQVAQDKAVINMKDHDELSALIHSYKIYTRRLQAINLHIHCCFLYREKLT